MNKRTLTGLVILGCIIIILVWDLIRVLQDGGYQNTISAWVGEMSKEFPVIPLLTGIVCGHFFWPMAKENQP